MEVFLGPPGWVWLSFIFLKTVGLAGRRGKGLASLLYTQGWMGRERALLSAVRQGPVTLFISTPDSLSRMFISVCRHLLTSPSAGLARLLRGDLSREWGTHTGQEALL